MALLEVRGLEKWYGRRQVVNGVDFEVNRGEVVGLLGPNGAGKTTSFRMTIGLIDADGGKVVFDGRDVTSLPMYQRARAGMGYLAQDSSVFKQLSVEDNLMAILETRRDMNRRQRKDRQNELLDQFGLAKIRKTKANRVSGGERRRLEIARSLITEPKLIMLDEPFAGIDPKTVAEIQDQIRSLVETYNIGILLTDHQFRETLEVTDRTYVIREGRVFAYGKREQILNNADVRRYYIGDRFDVGHLLDKRHVHAIGDGGSAPEEPAGVPVAAGPTPPPVSPSGDIHLMPIEDDGPDHDDDEDAELAAGLAREAQAARDAQRPPTNPPPPPPQFGPPFEEPFDFDRFIGGSVTVLGDVVIEQVDLDPNPPAKGGDSGRPRKPPENP